MAELKIASVRTQRFDIALGSPIRMAFGEVRVRNFVLVRIRDADGVEGVGETGALGGPYWGQESAESIEAAINNYIAPLLVGRTIGGLNGLAAWLCTTIRGNEAARNGVEMAALDLIAKRSDQRAADVLGGSCRDRLPVAWTLSTGSVETDIEDGERAIAERGHRRFKLKFTRERAEADVARAIAIIEAFRGRANVIVDVNQAWDEVIAARYLPILAEAGLEAIEQPMPAAEIDKAASFKVGLPFHMIADEGIAGPTAMLRLAAKSAASAVSLKPNRDGGPSATRQVAAIALAAGMELYGGTMLETTLGTAASAHVYSAMPRLGLGTELFGPFRLSDDIAVARLPIQDGMIDLPARPGWGVTLDEDKIEFLVRQRGH